jgi:signal peptidase I
MRHSGILIAVIDDALTSGTVVRFRAEGASMYPAIRDGETITVVAVSPDAVVRGDVLLCRHGTRVLAHRVVGVALHGTERWFQLKGDAKIECDGPVRARAIVGAVVNVRRNGRFIPLGGRASHMRRAARAAGSRARRFVASGATVFPVLALLNARLDRFRR